MAAPPAHRTRMNSPRVNRLLCALLLAGALGTLRAEEPLPATVEFNRDIRPIFSDVCYKCHGPDKAKRKADLRLDVEASAKEKHDDGIAVVPGHPDESELIRRLTTTDAEDHMPPAKEDRQLTARQVELLRRWIEQGAKWEAHWSFIAPRRPELPQVEKAGWARNPVDRFI